MTRQAAGAASGGKHAPASSAELRALVMDARERQLARYGEFPQLRTNADAPGRWLDAHGQVTVAARELLMRSAESLGLSARGYHRSVRVARTIADLSASHEVLPEHVAEALRYRDVRAG